MLEYIPRENFPYFAVYQFQQKKMQQQQQDVSSSLSGVSQKDGKQEVQEKGIIDQLKETILQLESENKRLKSRIADMEPHKQKNLRCPNQSKIEDLFEKFCIKRFALKVCYLGFSYDGMAYQKMNDDNTIEAYIFKALHTMSLVKSPVPGEDYTRAGRTDKGVSAMGNVISLKLRSNELKDTPRNEQTNKHKTIQYCSMLNAILPQDIRILACEQVTEDFNARYWCTKRSYKYFFAKNNLSIDLMKQGIKYFIGTHNFINFCKINLTNTVNFQRIIYDALIVKSEVDEVFQTDANQVYYFYFVGNSFLWHQIRFMSAILFMIGSGQEKPQIIRDLLDLSKFAKKPNYPMAPEYPLILEDCEYPQVKLDPDLKTTLAFYKTFNQLVMRKSTEKTLMINCMKMAQRDLMKSTQITEQFFLNEYKKLNKPITNKSGKTLSMHKSSGRSLEETKQSLKGKKLEQFKKKMQRFQQYEKKQKQQLEEKILNGCNQQQENQEACEEFEYKADEQQKINIQE